MRIRLDPDAAAIFAVAACARAIPVQGSTEGGCRMATDPITPTAAELAAGRLRAARFRRECGAASARAFRGLLAAGMLATSRLRFDTGLEHGPQTYLQRVASAAAEVEADRPGEGRGWAIEAAFGVVPSPLAVDRLRPSAFERNRVWATLDAGDHCADLAALRAR